MSRMLITLSCLTACLCCGCTLPKNNADMRRTDLGTTHCHGANPQNLATVSLRRKVCSIQSPLFPTTSIVLAPEGHYLSDVVRLWEYHNRALIDNEGRSRAISTTFPRVATQTSRSSDPNLTEEIDRAKNFLKDVKQLAAANSMSDAEIANTSYSLGGGNYPSDELIVSLGEKSDLYPALVDYLVARATQRKLNQQDEVLLTEALGIDSESIKKLNPYLSNPTDEAKSELAKAFKEDTNIAFVELLRRAVIFNAKRDEDTLKSVVDDVGTSIGKTIVAAALKAEEPAPVETSVSPGGFTTNPQAAMGDGATSSPFDSSAIIVRKTNGLQFGIPSSRLFSSPLGSIHIDDGDTITIVPWNQLLANDSQDIRFTDLLESDQTEPWQNVAVVTMLLNGRSTELLLPLDNSMDTGLPGGIPQDAMVVLSNFGRLPIIAASRAIMERRLRGEPDELPLKDRCSLLSKDSRLKNTINDAIPGLAANRIPTNAAVIFR